MRLSTTLVGRIVGIYRVGLWRNMEEIDMTQYAKAAHITANIEVKQLVSLENTVHVLIALEFAVLFICRLRTKDVIQLELNNGRGIKGSSVLACVSGNQYQ